MARIRDKNGKKLNRVWCDVCKADINARVAKHELTQKHLKEFYKLHPSLFEQVIKMREDMRQELETNAAKDFDGTVTVI